MSITPQTVSAGSNAVLRFAGALAETRGGYFVIRKPSGEGVAGLWSDRGEDSTPGFTVDLDDFVVLDYAVSGVGPDRIVIPPTLTAGTYELCTENSRPAACVDLTVIER